MKTVKTAGTTTEMVFERFCVPEADPLIIDASRCLVSPAGIVGARGTAMAIKDEVFRNHMTVTEVKALLGGDIWDDYFTFANVRNPWDKLVSQWFFRNRNTPGVTSESLTPEVMDSFLQATSRPQVEAEILAEGTRVDETIRFEDLANEILRVAVSLGLQIDTVNLPKAKTGIRPEGSKDYRRYFSADGRQLIADRYADWIECGGYTF